MSDNQSGDRRLHIKKYPNRRLYDATHSRHVTLPELHELICGGTEIVVHDAKSGADITNTVLMQIIAERDAEKLSFFPPNILHQVIRTQQQLLGGVAEQFFRQTLDTYRASHDRWAEFLRNTLGNAAPAGQSPPFLNPLEWAQGWWMNAHRPAADSPATPQPPNPDKDASEVENLRRQLAELSARVERLTQSSG